MHLFHLNVIVEQGDTLSLGKLSQIPIYIFEQQLEFDEKEVTLPV
jgi:hypothetical protein